MVALTNFVPDPLLDLEPWVGQRQATFKFFVTDAVTNKVLGEITPLRNANLTHDSGSLIKRTLRMELGKTDAAAINPVSDRVQVYMKFPDGTEYPLGKYMFADASLTRYTSGTLGQYNLNDEMFLVDQEIGTAINGVGIAAQDLIARVVQGLPIKLSVAASPYLNNSSWDFSTSRGSILESLSVVGDYFSPWFANDGKLTFIRTFDPARKVYDLDFDLGNKVLREGIVETSDLLTAPNVIIVVSNSNQDDTVPVASVAYVSPNAPNSVAKRGFRIPKTYNLQLNDQSQAVAVAAGLAQRNTILEKVTLTTAPDPRHDSYNVIRWRGDPWLELSWSLDLMEGGRMSHVLRKAYKP